MHTQTVNDIAGFFEKLDDLLGISVPVQYCVKEKGKFPLYREDNDLVIVPAFFNHPDFNNDIRTVLMAELYSCFYLDRKKDGYLEINPGFMAKGICGLLGIPFFSDDEIEENLRMVRRKLFDDLENGCYFEVGRRLQESAFEQYEVTDILRQGEHETFITVKTIGRWGDGSERTMTEEELFTRCCTGYHLKDEKVDMRRNLFVISGPSGVGKDEVVKAFIEKYPGIKKAVSVTTRRKRSDETEGVDYYYITKEAFSDHRINERLVEFELFDGDYYGTLYSEIERHPEDEPLVLVVDVRGRRSIIKRYPLAKSIFISPPTDEMLVKHIISKYKNAPGEMTHRLTVAKEELEQACMYDHLVVNEDMDTCVREIFQIVAANNGKQHREES